MKPPKLARQAPALRTIAIGGRPATGKSTLMREFMRQYANECGTAEHRRGLSWQRFTYGTIKGHRLGRVWILGVYEDGLFDGTDRLSMSCQHHFRYMITSLKSEDAVVIWEGNRLFKTKLLAFARERSVRSTIIVLTAGETTLDVRHHERRDNQTIRTRRARATELTNTTEKITTGTVQTTNRELSTNADITIWSNETPDDLRTNTARMLAMVR